FSEVRACFDHSNTVVLQLHDSSAKEDSVFNSTIKHLCFSCFGADLVSNSATLVLRFECGHPFLQSSVLCLNIGKLTLKRSSLCFQTPFNNGGDFILIQISCCNSLKLWNFVKCCTDILKLLITEGCLNLFLQSSVGRAFSGQGLLNAINI